MKKDSERTIASVAQVEVSKVIFDKGVDLGIEFKNQIDAWNKMQFKFRSYSRVRGKYVRQDLAPLVYAMRERLE